MDLLQKVFLTVIPTNNTSLHFTILSGQLSPFAALVLHRNCGTVGFKILNPYEAF